MALKNLARVSCDLPHAAKNEVDQLCAKYEIPRTAFLRTLIMLALRNEEICKKAVGAVTNPYGE